MSVWAGEKLRLEITGGSHGTVRMSLSGIRKGHVIDKEAMAALLERRAPGRSELVSGRREPDAPVFLCGISKDGVTDGTTVVAEIPAADARSSDYAAVCDVPRPSHADYAALLKYGSEVDLRGGGVFSGRMTAPMTVAGAIAQSILLKSGIVIGAHLYAVGSVTDRAFDPVSVSRDDVRMAAGKAFPALDDGAASRMRQAILSAKEERDSIGGIVECAAVGVPAGFGSELFGGLEGRIASLLYAVPAVKGVSFGAGFEASAKKGSENNDPFIIKDGKVTVAKNDAGGILGGISTGMPILFRAAFKPTPSIGREQQSVSLSRKEEVTLQIGGRHDPCVALRAVPVCEALMALALLDASPDGEADGTGGDTPDRCHTRSKQTNGRNG